MDGLTISRCTSSHASRASTVPPDWIVYLVAKIRVCRAPVRADRKLFVQDTNVLARLLGTALETGYDVRRERAGSGHERDIIEFKQGRTAISCCSAECGALGDRKGRAAYVFRLHIFKVKVRCIWKCLLVRFTRLKTVVALKPIAKNRERRSEINTTYVQDHHLLHSADTRPVRQSKF